MGKYIKGKDGGQPPVANAADDVDHDAALAAWWAEDADRVNRGCKAARDMGIVMTPPTKPPALTPEGGLDTGPQGAD